MTDTPTPQDAHQAGPVHGDPQDARPPLRRSREQKVVSGVCGGLGRFFDVDPVIFRVVLGVLAVSGGLGLILYGFAWLLIPLEGEEENEARRMLSGRVEGPALTAVLCALVGCGLFLSMLNNSAVMSFALMLTAAMAGAAYWSYHRHEPGGEAAVSAAQKVHKAQKTAAPPPETKAPPAPGGPSWWRDPIIKDGTTGPIGAGTGYLWGPDDGPPAEAERAPFRLRPERASTPLGGTPLGGWTFLAAVVAFALGTGLTWRHHPLGTCLEAGLACALAVFGLGMTVSSRYGRTGGGTVVAAVLTALLLAGAAGLPKSVSTRWTHSTWRPETVAAVRDEYRVGSGVGELDLTGLPWQRGGTVATRAEVGAGQLKLIVPDDVTARITMDVGVGDIRLPGEARDDVDVRPEQKERVTLEPRSGKPSRGTLEIRLKVGIGQVEVDRASS